MIPLSTKTAIRWQAPWDKEPDSLVLFYRAASVIERELFEAEAAGYDAARVFEWDLKAAFAEGLAALLPDNPEDVERLTEIRDRIADGAETTAAEQAELTEVTQAITKYWAGFRALVDRAARREAVMPVLAVRRFMSGWENMSDTEGLPLPFRRGADGMVAEELLSQLASVTLRAFGLEIYHNLYGLGAEKNLEPPLKSGGDPKTSNSRRRKAAVGKSAMTSGNATPH